MKIQIQAYWNAEVSSIDSAAFHKKGITPEKYLEENPEIHICDIVIDGEVVGTVAWDGKELSINKFRTQKTPLEALKEANKRNK